MQIHDQPSKASVYLYVNQRLLNTTVNKLNKLYMAFMFITWETKVKYYRKIGICCTIITPNAYVNCPDFKYLPCIAESV